VGPVPVRSIVGGGLIAAAVFVYLALVGLLERFADLNLVGEQITLGRVLLVLPPFVAGYVATRPRVVAGERRVPTAREGAVAGAAVGLVASGAFGAAVAFADWFDVNRIRQVFIAASPGLIEFVTFDRGLAGGLIVLVVLGIVAGLAGGMIRSAPAPIRMPLVVGASATLLMGLLQRIVPVAMRELGLESDFLYSRITHGLTWAGGIGIFAVAAVARGLWTRTGPAARERVRSTIREQPATRTALLVILLALLAILPLLVGSVISQVLGTVMVFLLLGLGLNIVVGYAGLLDLGYVAFFAFGAYALGLLSGATLNTTAGAASPAFSSNLNFYVAVVVVAILAAGLGLLIGAPVLRLRGDYLAIVTLGLGEIVSILTQSRWLAPIVGGPQGMRGITDAEIAGFSFRAPQHFYYLALAFVILAIFVSWRLSSSRVGRAWNAMREDEQVADAMGISTTRYKLLAFAMGGAVGSLGGALFAVKIGSLTPASFEILVSITALAVVILGGLGSIPGVVVGALVLIGLPGLLREFEEYRLLIYGGVLVAIMVLRPQGLVPNVRRMRELQEEEVSQDVWAKPKSPEEVEESYAALVAGGRLGAEPEEEIAE
jgi:branched-chain amino acid transport system permease protein